MHIQDITKMSVEELAKYVEEKNVENVLKSTMMKK
jgi:hypothetical protein